MRGHTCRQGRQAPDGECHIPRSRSRTHDRPVPPSASCQCPRSPARILAERTPAPGPATPAPTSRRMIDEKPRQKTWVPPTVAVCTTAALPRRVCWSGISRSGDSPVTVRGAGRLPVSRRRVPERDRTRVGAGRRAAHDPERYTAGPWLRDRPRSRLIAPRRTTQGTPAPRTVGGSRRGQSPRGPAQHAPDRSPP